MISGAAAGSVAVVAGLSAALMGMSVTVLGLAGRHGRWDRDARRLACVMTAAAVVAVAVMEHALITRDFTVKFVADNGSSATPALFNIATLWSALEGSILLWALVLCGYVSAVSMKFRSRGRDPMIAWAMLVLFAVSAFFFSLMAGPADPFQSVEPPPGYDGPGPNPLLQTHLLMAFHPPILYLGYVGFTVPFAFAIAALATGRLDGGWLTAVRRWTVMAWGFLTLGIVLGAWWSYETLGWGGYWAWDPVENASLLPWLTGTAYLHSVIVQERRGMLRVWNLSLAVSTFSLTILGTFFTRSGVLASVHSFTESGIGPAILGFFAVVVTVSLALIAWRGDRLRSGGIIASPASREAAFLANNALFAAFAFVVLLGTVFPLLVEAFDGRAVSVGGPYFDRMTRPIGLSMLFLMAVAPVLPWGGPKAVSASGGASGSPSGAGDGRAVRAGRGSGGRRPMGPLLSRRLLAPMWMAAASLAAAVVVGARGWAPLLTFGLGGFAGGTALRHMLFAVRRHRWRGLVGRTNGGMIVHLGVVLVGVAFAASQSYVRQAEFDLVSGQTASFAGHEVVYVGSAVVEHVNRVERVAYVRVDDAKVYGPAIASYPLTSRTIGVPSVRSTWRDDVALSVLAFPESGVGDAPGVGLGSVPESGAGSEVAPGVGPEPGGGDGLATGPGLRALGADRVVLRVTVQPLVSWLWLGGAVMALGTVLSLVSVGKGRRRAPESSGDDSGRAGRGGRPAAGETPSAEFAASR